MSVVILLLIVSCLRWAARNDLWLTSDPMTATSDYINRHMEIYTNPNEVCCDSTLVLDLC